MNFRQYPTWRQRYNLKTKDTFRHSTLASCTLDCERRRRLLILEVLPILSRQIVGYIWTTIGCLSLWRFIIVLIWSLLWIIYSNLHVLLLSPWLSFDILTSSVTNKIIKSLVVCLLSKFRTYLERLSSNGIGTFPEHFVMEPSSDSLRGLAWCVLCLFAFFNLYDVCL